MSKSAPLEVIKKVAEYNKNVIEDCASFESPEQVIQMINDGLSDYACATGNDEKVSAGIMHDVIAVSGSCFLVNVYNIAKRNSTTYDVVSDILSKNNVTFDEAMTLYFHTMLGSGLMRSWEARRVKASDDEVKAYPVAHLN